MDVEADFLHQRHDTAENLGHASTGVGGIDVLQAAAAQVAGELQNVADFSRPDDGFIGFQAFRHGCSLSCTSFEICRRMSDKPKR